VRLTTVLLSSCLVASSLGFAPVTSTAAEPSAQWLGENIAPISQFEYGNRFDKRNNYGTDSDFIQMEVMRDSGEGVPIPELRDVAVFGSIGNGAFIMDVTDGEPVELAWYECSLGQGDIQVFQRDEDRGTATYFTFTDDGYSSDRVSDSACTAWGTANDKFGSGQQGTFIVDITDPTMPETINFVPFTRGSHNMTVTPDGMQLWNSNSELIVNAANAGIEIFDITDLANPIDLGVLELPVRPGLGTDSHDISFNSDGTRAYSAALSQTVIIATGLDPETGSYDNDKRTVLTSVVDPMINVEHQAERFALTDSATGLERDFLIIEDEFAGAAAGTNCPSGGTHVYDITGPLEQAPVKLGVWFIDDLRATNGLASCTAHVFQIDEEAQVMTMAFYNGGVRVVDLSGLIGVSLGSTGIGMKEIGFHRFEDSNSWSVKAPRYDVAPDGTLSAYLYSNDINRGLDVYRFEGSRAGLANASSQWFSATDALATFGAATVTMDYTPFCLLKDGATTAAVVPTLR
jgi:hypothetical protein